MYTSIERTPSNRSGIRQPTTTSRGSGAAVVVSSLVNPCGASARKRKSQEQKQSSSSYILGSNSSSGSAGDFDIVDSSYSHDSGKNDENHHYNQHPNKKKHTKIGRQEDKEKEPSATTITNNNNPQSDNDKINDIVTQQLWSESSEQVARSMNTLYRMLDRHHTNNYEENRQTAFRRGGHLAIVQAMIRNNNSSNANNDNAHKFHHQIQRDGCLALMRISLCGLNGARQDIVEIGAVKCCRRAVLAGDHNKSNNNQQQQLLQQQHPSLHTAAIKLIRNLWIAPAVRRAVIHEGGLTIVLHAMDQHKHHADVQRCGCQALFALLCQEHHHENDDYHGGHSCWAKTVVEAGSIEIVVAAMQACPRDSDLQAYGCKLLFALAEIDKHNHQQSAMRNNNKKRRSSSTGGAVSGSYRERIVQAKGLVAIVEAKRMYEHDERVMVEVRKAIRAIGI